MRDLESGLHIILRSDIGNFKSINGEKLSALKEWLRVLDKVYIVFFKLNCYLHIIIEVFFKYSIHFQVLSGSIAG